MTPEMSAALDALNADLAEAEEWMQAWNEPERPPSWVYPVTRMIERIRQQADALETLIRRQGAPA